MNIKQTLWLIFLLLLFVTACNSVSPTDRVEINLDKVEYVLNDTAVAKLYVEHSESVLPDFNIVEGSDTFLIPFDVEKDCGVFKAVCRKVGRKEYKGFVDVVLKNGKEERYNYSVILTIKE